MRFETALFLLRRNDKTGFDILETPLEKYSRIQYCLYKSDHGGRENTGKGLDSHAE